MLFFKIITYSILPDSDKFAVTTEVDIDFNGEVLEWVTYKSSKIELSVRNGAHKISQLHRGWAGAHNLRHLGQGEKLGVRQESGHERCNARAASTVHQVQYI